MLTSVTPLVKSSCSISLEATIRAARRIIVIVYDLVFLLPFFEFTNVELQLQS